jgi:hypothetical protein
VEVELVHGRERQEKRGSKKKRESWYVREKNARELEIFSIAGQWVDRNARYDIT